LTGVSALKLRDEAWVQDVPGPLLRAITLPVKQVLESPALRLNLQETPHRIIQLAIDETGMRGGPGNIRQRAVRHRFDSGQMKGGMYTKGTGQQKTNSRGANNLGYGKWADNPGGEFAGFHPEGQIPGR
jgi:hypothetical protein